MTPKLAKQVANRLNELTISHEFLKTKRMKREFVQFQKGRRMMVVVNQKTRQFVGFYVKKGNL